MITVQNNIQSYIDKSGHDTVKIEYNGQSKTLIRKNVSTIGSEGNPVSFFLFTTSEPENAYRCLDLDLNSITYTPSATSSRFAVDLSDGSWFALEDGYMVNTSFDVNGTFVISSVDISSIGDILPCIYDGTYLWGHIFGERTVYRFSKDLLTIDAYTLKAGVLDDQGIQYISLSEDGYYIYIACVDAVGRFIKSQAGISGDADWECLSGLPSNIFQLVVDSDSNVYIAGRLGADDSRVVKLSNAGSILYTIPSGGTYIQYSSSTKSIYTTDAILLRTNIWQLSAETGDYIGCTQSLQYVLYTPIICNSDTIVVGQTHTNMNVYSFDISDNWGEDEPYILESQFFGSFIHMKGLGDPAGFNNNIIAGGSAICHGYTLDIKTKTKIEEIN